MVAEGMSIVTSFLGEIPRTIRAESANPGTDARAGATQATTALVARAYELAPFGRHSKVMPYNTTGITPITERGTHLLCA